MLKPNSAQPSREPSPFPLSAVDRVNARRSDEDFAPHTWEDAKQIIAENRLEAFKRWPSDVRRYVDWSVGIRSEFGSVQTFVMKNRLGWTLSSQTTPQSGPLFDYADRTPFADPNDYKILPNDWPYGFESGITHLIVWLKPRLEIEPVKGDITPTARRQIEEFVQWKFIDQIKHLPGYENMIRWFKNWTALQSVPGMDHIHVLTHDVPENIVQDWVR